MTEDKGNGEMGVAADDGEETNKKMFGSALVWAACILLAGTLGFVGWMVVPLITTDEMTAEEMVMEWVETDGDELEAEMVVYISGNSWLVSELGNEFLAHRVADGMVWQYALLGEVGDGLVEVKAVGSVSFDATVGGESGRVNAYLPFVVRVDVADRVVEEWNPDLFGASFSTTIPGAGVSEDIEEPASP